MPSDFQQPATPPGSAPCSCSPTALDGYKAASILIERMLNNAEKKKPLQLRRVKQKSADYRQGVYDAILTAHCWMVLGEYPAYNCKQIVEVLKSANVKLCHPADGDGGAQEGQSK